MARNDGGHVVDRWFRTGIASPRESMARNDGGHVVDRWFRTGIASPRESMARNDGGQKLRFVISD